MTGTIEGLLGAPLVDRLGGALLHSLWQGAAVGLVLAAVLAALRRAPAASRYWCACAALGLMVILPAIRFARGDAREGERRIEATSPAPPIPSAPASAMESSGAGDKTGGPSSWDPRVASMIAKATRSSLPVLVAAWLTGVVLLSARLLGGWIWLARLVRRGSGPLAGPLAAAVERLRPMLRVGRPVRLLEARATAVPMVVGWLRPAILIPASALSGLTPGEWEAILAHELAHVRRHDYLVNLLQCVAETLLFYHPAAWWTSRAIRAEREHCCDDLAVSACGGRAAYARALLALERLRPRRADLVPTASGGSLLARIRRVLGLEPAPCGVGRDAVGLAAALAVSLLLAGGAVAVRHPWQADPFAGTRAVEVRLNAGKEVHVIEDPTSVASLLRKLQVVHIDNDIAAGSIPSAFLTFRKADGTSSRFALEGPTTLSSSGGLVRIRGGFVDALNRHLTAAKGRPIDVLQFPVAPLRPPPPPIVRASRRSLEAGFKSVRVQYRGTGQAPSLRWARIADPATLDELQRALVIVGQEPVGREWSPVAEFTSDCKDGSTFRGQIEDAEHLFDFDAGRFTISARFVQSLNDRLGRMLGRPVDVLSTNPPPEGSAELERALRARLAEVASIRYRATGESWRFEGTAREPSEVADLIGSLRWAERADRDPPAPPGDFTLDMTTKQGEAFRATFLRTGMGDSPFEAGPLTGDLVESPGLGRFWVDDQWKYRFQQHQEDAQRAASEREELEATREACRDLGVFLRQVRSVTAEYREGGQQLRAGLTHERSARVVRALSLGTFEGLDWSRERWAERLKELDAGQAGELHLTPGLGYSLRLVISGDRELLVPRFGRIRFEASPIEAVRGAIADDPGMAKGIGLLPTGDADRPR